MLTCTGRGVQCLQMGVEISRRIATTQSVPDRAGLMMAPTVGEKSSGLQKARDTLHFIGAVTSMLPIFVATQLGTRSDRTSEELDRAVRDNAKRVADAIEDSKARHAAREAEPKNRSGS